MTTTLSKAARKALKRSLRPTSPLTAYTPNGTLRPHEVIPPGTETECRVVMLARREGQQWGTRSRLFDLNFLLHENKLSPEEAETRALARVERWQRFEPTTEFLIHWRYGRPCRRPLPPLEAPTTLTKRTRKPPVPKLTLEDL